MLKCTVTKYNLYINVKNYKIQSIFYPTQKEILLPRFFGCNYQIRKIMILQSQFSTRNYQTVLSQKSPKLHKATFKFQNVCKLPLHMPSLAANRDVPVVSCHWCSKKEEYLGLLVDVNYKLFKKLKNLPNSLQITAIFICKLHKKHAVSQYKRNLKL